MKKSPTKPVDKAALRRRKDLAAIHVIAAKQLRLDEETYRALLERVAGVRSAAELDVRGRIQVLQELRRLTGEGGRRMRNALPGPDAPQNVRDEIAGMVAKVGAILAEAERGWPYAHGLAVRMFKVQRVEWLKANQLHRLVAALAIDQKRRRSRDQGEPE